MVHRCAFFVRLLVGGLLASPFVQGAVAQDEPPPLQLQADSGSGLGGALHGRAQPTWTSVDPPASNLSFGAQWIEISTQRGNKLLAAVSRPGTDEDRPLVVLLHGGHGFLEQYVQLGRELADAGFVTLAGCLFANHQDDRTSPPIECPNAPPEEDPRAQLREAEALVAAGRSLPGVRADRVGLFGHSRGASVAVWYSALVGDNQAAVLNSGGYSPGLRNTAPTVKVPLLLLHGTADRAAPPVSGPNASIESARGFEAQVRGSGGNIQAVYYDGADHLDFWSAPNQRSDSLARIIAFFSEYLEK